MSLKINDSGSYADITALHIKNPEYVVPSGYTQLEYIESTGSQYINTGWTPPTDNTAIAELVLAWTSLGTEQKNGCRGSMWGSSGPQYPKFMIGTETQSNISYSSCNLYGSNYANVEVATLNTIYDYILDTSNHTFTVDGTVHSLNSGTLDNDQPFFLFAASYWSGTTNWMCSCRIYKFIGKSSSTVQRYMVPAKRNSDNVLGMYDTISNTFYANSGSGDFVAGNEIPQYLSIKELYKKNGSGYDKIFDSTSL